MLTKIAEIKNLVKLLNQYRDSYYNKSESIVSDHEYDDLFDKLEKLENETGIVLSNSPTQTVGYEVKSKLEKITHSHPMLSLGKTKILEDLLKFAKDKDVVLSCKMDGLTVLLTYENGELVRAETRGNGEIGEDVTHNARFIKNIPLHIPYTQHFEIEGEAIITYDDFERINHSLPANVEKYKNPRNLVSGSIRQLDNKIAKNRNIKFIVWKVPTSMDKDFGCQTGRFAIVQEFGFDIVPCYSLLNTTIENLQKVVDKLKNTAKEKQFPIDGLVISYDDIAYGQSLGMTGHHPKHSLAFKFYDDEYITKFINFDWTMGKTGVLTPTAVFQPVEIDGTIVERASMHNVSIAESFKLRPGDNIEVFKANMIIPQVKSNLTSEKRDDYVLSVPYTCPICGSRTQLVTNGSTTTLECSNPDCKGKLLGKLVHFCSKHGADIEGLSESTLEKFIELGWIKTLGDIYALDMYEDEMMNLEGFGQKSVRKLLDSIEQSTNITLDKFICSLSIPLIGKTASKTIAKHFGYDWESFRNGCEEGFNFSQLNDFGIVMADEMDEYLDHHLYEMDSIAEHFEFIIPEMSTNLLLNKVFCITGSLEIFNNRDDLKNKIESLGGKVSGSVSKNTFALVNNDVNSTSSKNKKAKELGVKIITEQELMKMIENK